MGLFSKKALTCERYGKEYAASMKKKSVSVLLSMVIVLGIVGCGNSVPALNESDAEKNTEEVADRIEADNVETVSRAGAFVFGDDYSTGSLCCSRGEKADM